MNINSTRGILFPVTLCFLIATLASVCFAQTEDSVEKIKTEQQQLAERYKQLEAKLFSLHQFEKDSNPGRSKLLQKAFLQSQEKLTNVQLTRAVKLINDGKYKDAEEMQTDALASLTEMLKLLQAEDRSQQIRDEIERYKEYLKEVNRLERQQKSNRGQADAGLDMERVAKSQEATEKRTGDLAEKMQSDSNADAEAASDSEGAEGAESEGSPSEGSPSEGSPSEGSPSEGSPSEGSPSEGSPSEGSPSEGSPSEGSPSEGSPSEGSPSEGSPSEGSPSEGSPSEGSPSEGSPSEGSPSEGSPSEGSPSEGSPSEGSPSEGSPSEGSPSEGGEPAEQETGSIQERIEKAEERMKAATEALKQAKRDDATDLMKEAEKELAAAKEELEEILRQLREEEVDSNLKQLEERFRAMLEQQTRVNEATDKLALTPSEARTTEFEIKANRLAGDQNSIVTAAGRALLLLKEDGSSIAFPVTVEEMQQDMMQVSSRLSEAKVNTITQEIEADIVATLNELIDALVEAQKENEEDDQEAQEQEQEEGSPPPPGEEPLVDQLAELKMLRSLQKRIFNRHQRYAKYLDDPEDPVGVSQEPDVVAALDRLAARQAQLADIARQLVNEQNE